MLIKRVGKIAAVTVIALSLFLEVPPISVEPMLPRPSQFNWMMCP